MKLRMKRNFLSTAWDKAVMYRSWELQEIEEFTDHDAMEHWSEMFTDQIGLLAKITTESFCTLHDMATIEAKERIEQTKATQRMHEELTKEINEAVA